MIYKCFKKFFKYYKEFKYKYIGYSILSITAAFLELLGVALVYPFVAEILSGNSEHAYNTKSLLIGLGIIFLFLLKNAFMILFVNLQARFTNKLSAFIKQKFMLYFLYSRYQDTYRISLAQKGKILGLLTPNFVNNFILRLLNLTINIFIFIAISLFLAIKFPLATLLTVIFAILMISFQNHIYKPMVTKLSKEISELVFLHNQAFNEAVLNLKNIKIANNEDYFNNNYVKTLNNLLNTDRKLGFLNQIPPYVSEPFSIMLLFVLLVIISLQTYTSPENLIASFALIASAMFRLTPTISRIQVNFNGINSALPQVIEFIEIYEKYKIYEKTKLIEKKEILTLKDNLELKNIWFKYIEDKIILKDINLKINKGEFIGIAGATGVGKTTLVDIIAGLFVPTSGKLLLDGAKFNGNLNIGYIPQEFKLIQGNIRENVAFGNSIIDDERVIDSLKKAQLYDFIIDNYKNGIYEAPFTDSVGFSQGQKQRLAIARALYSNPDILILDEATSSLDLKTEDEICNVLNQLKGEKTIIVIAHRLSTIKSADRIVYMENGTISAIAPFENLINISQGFKELVEIAMKK